MISTAPRRVVGGAAKVEPVAAAETVFDMMVSPH